MHSLVHLQRCSRFVDSNRILSCNCEQVWRFLTSLSSRNLLEKGTIHTSLFRVHHASKSMLFLPVHIHACPGHWECSYTASHGPGGSPRLHLVHQELLVGDLPLLTALLLHHPVAISLLCLLDPLVHVLLVSSCIVLPFHLLLADLLRKLLIQLLMLESVLVLLVNILQVRLLILLYTLLDVSLLLLELHLLVIIANDFTHAVHNGLNALASLGHLLLSCLFFLQLQPHV